MNLPQSLKERLDAAVGVVLLLILYALCTMAGTSLLWLVLDRMGW